MLSSSRRLALRLVFQRTRIPTTVRFFRTQSRKLLNWLKKKTASILPSEEEEEEEEKENEDEKAEIDNNEKTKPHAPILDLPLELMLMINDLLPLEAKCCLALTCKGLFEFNKDAVEAPEYYFMPGNPYDRRLMRNSDNLTTERWSLLRLLENEENIIFGDKNTYAESLKAADTSKCAYLIHGCILRSDSTCVATKIRAVLGGRGDLFIYTQYDPWKPPTDICYRRTPTLTNNESHRLPAILGGHLVRKIIRPNRKDLRESEIDINDEEFDTIQEY
ncbi:hypothetical protein FQN50_004646 [Emmonsiellopsis sp. PD_5]|nr:hypothetical protein FQN50_004646 [Emmonsiellopsis sp. PD_5]